MRALDISMSEVLASTRALLIEESEALQQITLHID